MSMLGLSTATVTFIPNPPTEIIGKKVKVKFMVKDLKRKEWFFGIITTYNGIFFPSDLMSKKLKCH